jgi:DNA-binding response OmpR family regulator
MTCPHCELGRFEREVTETFDAFFAHGIILTKQQTRLMAKLYHDRGVSRTESLISAIWYDVPTGEPEYAENIIKIHISKVRKKIRATGAPFKITPVWGLGYTFERPPEGKVLRAVGASLALTLLCIYPLSNFV